MQIDPDQGVFLCPHISCIHGVFTMKEQTHTYDELIEIKISTKLTTTMQDGIPSLDLESIERIAEQVKSLKQTGACVGITTSGAISAGYALTGEARTKESRKDIANEQRMSCLGQLGLMNAWQTALAPHLCGQLLATRQELASNEGQEALQVMERLFAHGDIPIRNENDALSHSEINFGDNDMLAAHFSALLHKSGLFRKTSLVLLSDVDGVYEDVENPKSVVPVITDIHDFSHFAGDSNSANSKGGMKSKFQAAEFVTTQGIDMYIANGRTEDAIHRTLNAEIGTYFPAQL